MLTNVKANNFFTFGDANTTKECSNYCPDYPGRNYGKDRKGSRSNNLNTKLAEAMTGKQTLVHIEQAHCKGCPDATDTVNGEGANRIVDLEAVDESNREHHKDA